MSGETPHGEGEIFVTPDESFRVSEMGKARAMAKASHTERTNAMIDREIQDQRRTGGSPIDNYTSDKAAEALAHDTKAEIVEQFAGLHYEADKLVEAVGDRVGLEVVYTYEQRAAEAKRDTEALQRTLDGLFDKPGREQDIQVLRRVLGEAEDRQTMFFMAFTKLRVKASEQTPDGHQFWDDYDAYKKSLTPPEKK